MARSRPARVPPTLSRPTRADFATHVRRGDTRVDYAPRVRPSLAQRVVRFLLRIAARVTRPKRGYPRAMASQRRRAPVGRSVAAHALLAVCGTGRVPNLSAWQKLVGLDYSLPLRRVAG